MATHIPLTTTLLMVRNATIVMTQATSPSYVGSPTDNQKLSGTAELDPTLTQRGTRGPAANADRADYKAEASRPL